jgi:hypothetical protein
VEVEAKRKEKIVVVDVGCDNVLAGNFMLVDGRECDFRLGGNRTSAVSYTYVHMYPI